MINKKIDVIILASGNSRRFIDKQKKQNKKINYRTLTDIAIEYFNNRNDIKNIIVTYNKKYPIITKYKKRIELVLGGKTRSQSVYNALNYINNNILNSHNVLIHDVARPYINKNDLNRLLKLKISTGIALGYPITNAVKSVNKNLVITGNINRDNLYLSFTPQFFNFKKIYKAYKKIIKNKISIDDDLEAMAYDSHKVKLMISSPGNIKITYKDDLDVLTKLLS